jgi:hypothetical protein
MMLKGTTAVVVTVAVISGGNIAAQTLEEVDVVPGIGTSFVRSHLWSLEGTSAGTSGLGLVWDWTTVQPSSGDTDRIDIMVVNGAPDSLLFPEATQVKRFTNLNDGSITDNYMLDTDTATWYLGAVGTQSLTVCDQPMLMYPYPFSFGETVSAPFEFPDGAGNSLVGSLQVSFIGTGTLMLPYGSFNDVRCIRRREARIAQGSAMDSTITVNDCWFYPGLAEPIARYQTFTSFGNTSTDAFLLMASSVLSVGSYSGQVGGLAYPTVATTSIYFEQLAKAVAYSAFDAAGRVMVSGTTDSNMDVSGWPKGMYVICLEKSRGRGVVRFIKE